MLKKCVAPFLIMVFASTAFAGVWNTATPTGTDPISQGDDRIREEKTAMQEALQWSGVFPGTNPLTAPMYQWTLRSGLQSARPTASLQNSQLYFSTDTGTIDRYDTATSSWLNVALSSNTTSGLNLTGQLIVGSTVTASTITTTLSALSIATNTAITGNLTVSGTFAPTTLTPSGTVSFPGMSLVIARGNSAGTLTVTSGSTQLVNWVTTETVDRLSEWNGSTFTAISTGKYCMDLTIRMATFPTTGVASMQFQAFINGSEDFSKVSVMPLQATVGPDFPAQLSYCTSLTAGDKWDFRMFYASSGGGSAVFDRSSDVNELLIRGEP